MPINGFFGKWRGLSNFTQLAEPIVMRNPQTGVAKEFWTTEAAYQAAKTLDDDEREKIRLANRPETAKKYGHSLKAKGKQRPDWEDVSLQVMEAVNRKKYEQLPFAVLLLSTGEEYLEETNPWHDTFYGVCDGVGLNHLGKILMKIREDQVKPAFAQKKVVEG